MNEFLETDNVTIGSSRRACRSHLPHILRRYNTTLNEVEDELRIGLDACVRMRYGISNPGSRRRWIVDIYLRCQMPSVCLVMIPPTSQQVL